MIWKFYLIYNLLISIQTGDVHHERLLFIFSRMISDKLAYTLTEAMCVKRERILYPVAISLIIVQIIVLSAFLFGCTRVITDASDELVMNAWGKSFDNGAEVSLMFDDDKATFSYHNGDIEAEISGVYVVSCDAFTICDDENYTFSYILHGDSLELSYNNSTIILEKA